jgi:hypothetical protein
MRLVPVKWTLLLIVFPGSCSDLECVFWCLTEPPSSRLTYVITIDIMIIFLDDRSAVQRKGYELLIVEEWILLLDDSADTYCALCSRRGGLEF